MKIKAVRCKKRILLRDKSQIIQINQFAHNTSIPLNMRMNKVQLQVNNNLFYQMPKVYLVPAKKLSRQKEPQSLLGIQSL